MSYNINFIVDKKTVCKICNKRRVDIKQHQKSKYCLAVKKILDKLSPKEVGLLKYGKEGVKYYY